MTKFIENVITYDGICYLSDWRKVEGYKSREWHYNYACENDSLNEFEEEEERIEEEFVDWCEENDLIPDTD